jgi:hypothetical protein
VSGRANRRKLEADLEGFDDRRAPAGGRRCSWASSLSPAWSTGAHQVVYSLCAAFGMLMLPYADYAPSAFYERDIGPPVSINIRLKLCFPPIAVGLRHGGVDRATMPKASVHEYGHTRSPEHDVGCHPEVRLWSLMDSEPQPASMERGSQFSLGCRVAPAIRLTHCRRGRRRRRWRPERRSGARASRGVPGRHSLAAEVADREARCRVRGRRRPRPRSPASHD